MPAPYASSRSASRRPASASSFSRSLMADDHVDILIVGAGLSGIGAACHVLENLPGKSFAILEARESIGGTWDLFRYPGIRSDSDMFTLGYSFRPWKEAEAIADGPSILPLHPRDRSRVRDRGPDPVQPSGGPRGVVERRRGMDGARRAHRHGRDREAHLRLPLRLYRLLPLRRGLYAAIRGDRHLPRPDRSPSTLARGPRLRGQARRRHRQRRDRGHARSLHGRARRARHHASALAQLHRHPPRPRPIRGRTQAPASGQGGVRRRALEERAAADDCLRRQPAHSQARPEARSALGREAAPRRIRHRYSTSIPPTSRGTSGSAWSRTAICSRRSAAAGPRSSPTASAPSPSAGSRSSPGRSSRPT